MEEIVAPDFGESVFEASVGRWFKAEGEIVQVGDPIVELHTDKAVQEINAVRGGVIGTLLKQVDDVVRPGEALCEFESGSALAKDEPTEHPIDEPVDEEIIIEEINVVDVGDDDANEEFVVEFDDLAEADDGFVEIQFGSFVEMPPASEPEAAAVVEDEPELPEVIATVVEESTPVAEGMGRPLPRSQPKGQPKITLRRASHRRPLQRPKFRFPSCNKSSTRNRYVASVFPVVGSQPRAAWRRFTPRPS